MMLGPCGRVPFIGAILLLGTLLPTSPALGVEPFENLGFTSFLDGLYDPRGHGFTYEQYLRYSLALTIKDAHGNDVAAFKDPRLDAVVSVNQFLFSFAKPKGFFASPGFDVVVPLVFLHSSFAPGGASLQDNGFGVGDIFIGPFLQFEPVKIKDQPVFFHRLEVDAQVPLGKYDPTKQLNQGNNAWTLNPSWAATLFLGPRLELSTRLEYAYNFNNPRPIVPAGPPGTPPLSSTKAGQAIFDNLASSYEVLTHVLRLGVAAYFFRQITDNQVNGKSVSNSQEQVFGIGPGVMWFPSPFDLLVLNIYFEMAVENRFLSNSVQIRWAHSFGWF